MSARQSIEKAVAGVEAAELEGRAGTGERRSRVMRSSEVLKEAEEKASSIARNCADSCADSSSSCRPSVREMTNEMAAET